MTANKKQKKAIRDRVAQTGESYAEARRRHLGDGVRDFVGLCDACGAVVEPEAGWIWLSDTEHEAACHAWEEFRQVLRDRRAELAALGHAATMDDRLRLGGYSSAEVPRRARWRVHHRECWWTLDHLDVRRVRAGWSMPYHMTLDRVRRHADLNWWSAHFGRKGLFDCTDWDIVLNEAHGDVFDRDWAAEPRRFQPAGVVVRGRS